MAYHVDPCVRLEKDAAELRRMLAGLSPTHPSRAALASRLRAILEDLAALRAG